MYLARLTATLLCRGSTCLVCLNWHRSRAGVYTNYNDHIRENEKVAAMTVVAHWYCGRCEVEGRDPAAVPSCWNCGSSVTVTARPSLEWTESALATE